jgi:hypothetical protein
MNVSHQDRHRTLAVVALALSIVFAAGACGGREQEKVVASAGESAVPMDVKVAGTGANSDTSAQPYGTLVLGERPLDYFWVQTVAPEDAAMVREAASRSKGYHSPSPGIVQTVAKGSSGEDLLVSGRTGSDLDRAVATAANIGALPTGAEFFPADAGALASARYQPGADSAESLSPGSFLLDLRLGDKRGVAAVQIPTSATSLAGLLFPLRPNDGIYSGFIDEGQYVTILATSANTATVVIGEGNEAVVRENAASLSSKVTAATKGR